MSYTSLRTRAAKVSMLAALSVVEQRRLKPAPELPDYPTWLRDYSPGWPWDAPQLLRIQKTLEAFTRGEIKRLMIFMPPRHLKSESVTVRYAAWRLERNPRERVIIAAYAQPLANTFSRKIRRVVRPRLELSPERNAVEEWETVQGGSLRAVGVGSGVTGYGADLIVIDDPIKGAEEADSPAYRERVWNWYSDDIRTRLEAGSGQMILIQTRWHRDDLAGRILKSDDRDNWHVLSLPAIDDAGVPLWPEKFGDYAEQKIGATDRGWHALYQQAPTAEGGVIVERDWFAGTRNRFDADSEAIAQMVLRNGRVLSFDTAEEASETAAYTACVMLELQPDYTINVRPVERRHLSIPALPDFVTRLARQHNRDGKLGIVLIEYKSSGKFAYQSLKQAAEPWLASRIRKFSPTVDKASRLSAAAIWMREDMIRIPFPSERVPDLADYEAELYDAPQSERMDYADATSQGIIYLRNYLAQGLAARRARAGDLARVIG